MYINFQQNRVSRLVKSVHTNFLAKNRKLHKFALPIVIKEKITSDRHHRITYTCISIFIQIGLVISLHCAHKFIFKNVSCINLQLPTVFFFKNRLFQSCIIVKCTFTSIFSKIGLIDQ